MKIAVISNLFPPNILGGAEMVAHSLALSLKADGHTVDVLTVTDADNETSQDGLRVFQIGSSPLYSPFWSKTKPGWMKPIWHAVDLYNPFMANKVKAILERIKPDIVHCHNIVGFSTAAWIVARKMGIPVVFHLHDYHLVCPRATLMDNDLNPCSTKHMACNLRANYHLKVLDGNIQSIISPSEFCVETVYSRFTNGRPKVPFHIIPNGTAYSEAARPAIDWAAGKMKILFLGGLFEHKGIGVLLDLIRKLNETPNNFEFHIGGKGPLEKTVVEFANSHDNVFFHGFVAGQKKLELFLDSHLFFFPSIWLENNPVTILEALSLGIPVLGSNIGGVPELLKPISEKLLFTPGDSEEARQRLLEFAGNRGFLATLSNGLLEKRERYGMKQQRRRVIEVFEQTISDHGSGK